MDKMLTPQSCVVCRKLILPASVGGFDRWAHFCFPHHSQLFFFQKLVKILGKEDLELNQKASVLSLLSG